MTQLADDVVASVADDSRLYTWRATTALRMSGIHVIDCGRLFPIVKLDETNVIVRAD